MNFVLCRQHQNLADDDQTLTHRYHSMKLIHLIYDERMALHRPIVEDPDGYTYENHNRIIYIYNRLMELDKRLLEVNKNSTSSEEGDRKEDYNTGKETGSIFLPIQCKPVAREICGLAHSLEYYDKMKKTSEKGFDFDPENYDIAYKDDDIYLCQHTFQAASLACGGVVQCVDAVIAAEGGSRRAVAVVRPPGHHSCGNLASGEY